MSEVKLPVNKNLNNGKNGSGISISKVIKENGMLIALVAVVVIFQILTKGIMLKPLNITNLIQQNGYILILAVGMLLVVIIGTVDLAVGSVSAFIGAVVGVAMVNKGLHPVLAIIVALAIGMIIGAIQGYWIAYKEIPGFVVTLAGQLVFRGLTMILLNGTTIAPFPTSFANLGSGFIPPLFYFMVGDGYLVGSSVLVGIALSLVFIWSDINKRKKLKKYNFNVESKNVFLMKLIVKIIVINVATLVLASYKGIPNILVISGVIIAIYTFITNKTVFGRQVYAVGGNKKAAALSGIKVAKV